MKKLTTLETCAIVELIESSRRCRSLMKEGSMQYLYELGYMYGILEMYSVVKLWV